MKGRRAGQLDESRFQLAGTVWVHGRGPCTRTATTPPPPAAPRPDDEGGGLDLGEDLQRLFPPLVRRIDGEGEGEHHHRDEDGGARPPLGCGAWGYTLGESRWRAHTLEKNIVQFDTIKGSRSVICEISDAFIKFSNRM